MSHPKSRAPREETKAVSRRDTFKLAGAVGVLGLGLGAVREAHAGPVPLKLKRASLGKISVRLFRQASSSASTSSAGAELLETLDLSSLTAAKAKGRYSLRLYNVRAGSEQLLSEQVLEVAESTSSK